MDGSFNNTIFLFFPQMPAMLAPLTEELLALTSLQAKTSLVGPGVSGPGRESWCHPSGIAC